MAVRVSADQRKQSLMRAAIVVFARSNYRAAGTAEIAREAGVSEPLLYRHFAGKRALFCELLDTIGRRILAVWKEAVEDRSTAIDALRRAGEVYFANLREHPAEARMQFQALAETADDEIASVLRTNHRRYVEFFEALLVRGQRDGSIRPDLDVAATARLLDGIGFAATMNGLLEPDRGVDGQESVMDQILEWISVPEPGGRP